MSERFDAGEFTLHRVRNHVWEIPKSGNMRVPARVLASRSLLEEISEDKTLHQLRNTTELPGIQTHALCMPDGHQGYGFPVGGVAGIDAEDGCISPGAVGYDINCVPGATRVELAHGRTMAIERLGGQFESERALVAAGEQVEAPIRLFTESGPTPVFEVRTSDGQRVRATADHEFETPTGMVPLSELAPGRSVRVRPFDGLPHADPDRFTVVESLPTPDESAPAECAELAALCPLESTDEAFHRLLKLVGYHTGMGRFTDEATLFFGQEGSLAAIAEEIAQLGFGPWEMLEAEAEDPEQPADRVLRVGSDQLRWLLERLESGRRGQPASGPALPWYLGRLADWQVALYLSTYAGAQMDPPTPGPNQGVGALGLSSPLESSDDHARRFLESMRRAFAQLGIESLVELATEPSTDPGSSPHELVVASSPSNVTRLLATVGYRYNPRHRREATLALSYLQTQADGRSSPQPAADSPAMTDGGETSGSELCASGQHEAGAGPVAPDSYTAYRERTAAYADGTVDCRIESIQPAGTVPVYDIGVSHDAHSFVADGFVVSNCGVRMMRTSLRYEDVQGDEERLVEQLFDAIPSGLGGGGIVQGGNAVEKVLERGMEWALEEGWATPADLAHCEDEGRRLDADADAVSRKARDRGRNQLGSLGSGNHFLEVQRVTDIFDTSVGAAYGLEPDQIVVLIHCGSRGLGHQVCTDYLRAIEKEHTALLSELPSKELAAAPAGSELATQYYGAMCGAINFAWVNRQLIMHRTREVFADVFETPWEDLGMELLYDVAHNIAKREAHTIDDEERPLFVHRKGATRSFPAGRPELPDSYATTGQPVIIPGSMGTGSYVLCGDDASMDLTFGSTAHGAGRLMSRTQAKREFRGETVQEDLRSQKVYIKAQSGATIAEEAPNVYKDIDEVVDVSDTLGIGSKVARTFPVCNIKG
jgi:tRNA-splicing ligase RtcB